MTLKELRKRFGSKQQDQELDSFFLSEQSSAVTLALEKLRNKPFWIWDKSEHRQEYNRTDGNCCTNHVLGLPRKNNVGLPLFDYEKQILDELFKVIPGDIKNKHIWIKKATALGISELFLRLIVFLCTTNDDLVGSEICIITAPRLELSVSLIDRLKRLFLPKLGITFSTKETVLFLNSVKIQAFPSHNLSAMRGIPNVSVIFSDETDFTRVSESSELIDVIERYLAKSNPYIILVSTPNLPGGVFSAIEQEPEETCIYRRLKLPYTVGLNKIYSGHEIRLAKASRSFEREYNLHYSSGIGDLFDEIDISKAIELGSRYPFPTPKNVSTQTPKVMGVDVAYGGSSNFAIVILEQIDGLIRVVYSQEFARPDFNAMIWKVAELLGDYRNISKVYIDGSAVSFIRAIKLNTRQEEPDYEDIIKEYRAKGWDWESTFLYVPVSFAVESRLLLGNLKLFIEREKLAIHPQFEDMLTCLRTAVEKGEGILDKNATAFDDTLDALRLACRFFNFKDRDSGAQQRAALVQSFEMNPRFS